MAAKSDIHYDMAEAELFADAMRRVGSTDFGGSDHLEGLRVLLGAIRADLDMDPADPRLRNWLLRPLISRLYTERGIMQDPAVVERPIARPLIIIGVPRSGTSALHQLIAANPAFQSLDAWLIRTPMRRPLSPQRDAIPEYRQACADFEARLGASEDLRAAHLMAPWEPDECAHLLAQSLICNAFGSRLSIPSYDAWWRAQDEQPAYRRLGRALRLIGADCSQRWLLKNPSHLLSLDALLAEFPDASVVHIHRDPLSTMPSLCSLLSKGRAALEGRPTDFTRLSERELTLWSDGLEKVHVMEQRYAGRVLNVRHADLSRDPIAVARAIHQFARARWDTVVEGHLRAWIAGNPAGRHGVHRYAADDFGLRRGQIARRFAAYRARQGFTAAAVP